MASSCFGLGEVSDEYDYRSDAYWSEMVPKRDGYLPTAEAVEEGVKRDALNTRIQLVAQNYKNATYDIDQCIRATVPSDGFREAAVKHWETVKGSHKIRAWTAVVLTVAAIATFLTPAPYLGLISVITGVYAAVKFNKMGKASAQVEGWRVDPAVALATERKKSYEKGFSYVYKNDLKLGECSHHAVLLPHEVEYLYNRYFDRICTELSAQRCINDQQKKSWLDRFRTDNPISNNILLYVFGRVPNEFASLSRNFESIAASLRDVEAEFSNARVQRKAETDQIISGIESQRVVACAIPSAALQYKLNEARDERDRRLRDGGGFNRDAIERDYEADKTKYHAIYAAAVLPINIYFDGKVKEARDALKDVLGVIARQEANAFSPYYEYSQGIVAATAAAKNRDFVYTQQPFNASQSLQIPAMPKIEINFVYQPPAGVDSTFWQH
ncbi:MAG TPA: hypothetical protein VLF94_05310 [Chlamydiales bacterium]|nr:hypothetical protein [Chlamydiales bacterium]